MKEPTKTFCILPWIHAATYNDGSALLCCVAQNSEKLNLNEMSLGEVWNSEHFKQARVAMLKGEKFYACQSCYKEEASGVRSHRQAENIHWYKELGEEYLRSLIEATAEDGTVHNDLVTLDLRLGNTCNLQCLMCRPRDSSKWVKDAKFLSENLITDARWDWKFKIQNYTTEEFEWYRNKNFLDNFYANASTIRHIIFGGGEPLYLKEHKEIIKKLVDLGYSNNIKLRYHTNGTIYDQEVVDLWGHFKFVEVMISVDGCKEINDYIRWPAKWIEIENNLRLYDQTGDNIDPKLLCTVQALNINHLPDFADWLLEQNYTKLSKKDHCGVFHSGTLHWPQYLCTKVLPKDYKALISQKLLAYADKNLDNKEIQKFRNQVEFMNSEDWSDKFDQTLDYLDTMDQRRGTCKSTVL